MTLSWLVAMREYLSVRLNECEARQSEHQQEQEQEQEQPCAFQRIPAGIARASVAGRPCPPWSLHRHRLASLAACRG